MRVLLAEDEETIVVTLRDALEEAGHEVVHAPDTDAAVSLLASDNPDVVLTDIRMPGEGGMEVLRRSVELDPRRETADADFSNNHFPSRIESSRLELFKRDDASRDMMADMLQTLRKSGEDDDENAVPLEQNDN